MDQPVELTTTTTEQEIADAITGWLEERPEALGQSQTIGQWLVTDAGRDTPDEALTPLEIVAESLYLALGGDSCIYDFDPTELQLFRVPCVEDDEEYDEVGWLVWLNTEDRRLQIIGTYHGVTSHSRHVVTLPEAPVVEDALAAALPHDLDAAVAALRTELIRLVGHVRDHLPLLPVTARVVA